MTTIPLPFENQYQILAVVPDPSGFPAVYRLDAGTGLIYAKDRDRRVLLALLGYVTERLEAGDES